MLRVFSTVAALLLVVVAFSSTAQAFDLAPPNPEIDPGSMASALTLLAGAGMLMADKLRRKAK